MGEKELFCAIATHTFGILCLYLPVEAVGMCALFPPWFLREAHWKGFLGYSVSDSASVVSTGMATVNAPSSSHTLRVSSQAVKCFLLSRIFLSFSPPIPPSSLLSFQGEVKRLPPIPAPFLLRNQSVQAQADT